MKRWMLIIFVAAALATQARIAHAHFGALIPSDDIVSQGEGRIVTLHAMFIHPMDNSYMQMEKPSRFGVLFRDKKIDLTGALREKKVGEFSTWTANYEIKRPGDYVFFVEPEPYWEPAEGRYIIHYTKVVVNAFGLERGWDAEVGMKTEIVPLSRPYGLWTGNVFRGIVKINGRPAPYAKVEVEYLNTDNVKPPADPYLTQVVKADSNGVFCYGIPRAGWWGFAAISERDKMMERDGKKVPVEIGAVIWVRTRDMK
ncbi:nickel uptake substrate-specific transmembrane region [bacterium BMS3Abin14]|nr:nickel uptake substrate-specific transmembrane region [bacterium BMS3Abin14]